MIFLMGKIQSSKGWKRFPKKMQCPDWAIYTCQAASTFPEAQAQTEGPEWPCTSLECCLLHSQPHSHKVQGSTTATYFHDFIWEELLLLSIPLWFIIPHPRSRSLSIFQWDINKSLTRMSCGCLSHFISQRPCLLCLSCSSARLSPHITWKASQNLSICVQQFIPQRAYRSLISHLVFLFLQAEKAIRANPPANYGSQVLFHTFLYK